jgi:hypothetical protein
LLGFNCHSRHPHESRDPVDAGVGVYWFPAFAGMTAVQAVKMIATNPACIAIFCPDEAVSRAVESYF